MKKLLIIAVILLSIIILAVETNRCFAEQAVSNASGSVTLPLQYFLDLNKKANSQGSNSPATGGIPVKYIFSNGSFNVSAGVSNSKIDGTVSMILYQSGLVEIPLMNNDMAISSASLDGKDLPLYLKDEKYHFLAQGIGRHTLRFSFFIKTNKNGNLNKINFSLPQSTVTNLNTTVPGTKLQVNINPSIVTGIKEKNGITSVRATIPSGDEAIEINWTPKEVLPEFLKKKRNAKPRIYCTTDTLISVKQDSIKATSIINYSILYNEIKKLSFAIPKDITIESVNGANFLNWEKIEGKDHDMAVVYLSSGVEGNYTLTITYEKPVKDINSTWAVPLLQAMDVERQTGTIGCYPEENIEVNMRGLQAAAQIDERDLPSSIKNIANKPITLSFKFQALPCQISIETKKLEDIPVLACTIDSARAITVVNDEGKALTTITYDVKNNQKQYIDLTLPPKTRLLSSFLNNNPVKPVKGNDEKVKIPLLKSKAESGNESFPIEITFITDYGYFRGYNNKSFLAPVSNIPISEFSWSLYLPEKERVLKFGGNMQLITQSSIRVSTSNEGKGAVPPPGPGAAPLQVMEDKEQFSRDSGAPAKMEKQKAFESQTLQKINQVVSIESKGLNPVKIYIPEAGRLYRFNKLLVIDKCPEIIGYFYQNWIYRLLGYILLLVTILFGMKTINNRLDNKYGGAWLVYLIGLFIFRPYIGEFFDFGFLGLFLVFIYWMWRRYSPRFIDSMKTRFKKQE